MRLFAMILGLFVSGSIAWAGEPALERYDLGQKLRQLERAWEAHPDPAARLRALPTLKRAVPLFFSGKVAEVAQVLDQSRFLLASAEPPSAETRWAEALVARPATRLLDPARGPLVIQCFSAYPTGLDKPTGLLVRASLLDAAGRGLARATVPAEKTPLELSLPTENVLEGDWVLRLEVLRGEQVLSRSTSGLSLVKDLGARLEALGRKLPPAEVKTTEAGTLRNLVELLQALARASLLETDYPSARMLKEAEALALALAEKQPFLGPQRPGQYWLAVATGTGFAPVRLFVPTLAQPDRKVPIVVALHGAGGSENLFFDAYGDGAIVKRAEERGWMVLATRTNTLFGMAPPVPAILDELGKFYPIDRQRVFVVGHSMGAAQAMALVGSAPAGTYAAVAPLGGGGGVRKPEAVQSLPVFIGCGSDDFALGGAKALAAALKKAGAEKVQFKEYPGIEHMVIVQEALRDVFAFFETAGQKQPGGS